MGDPLVTIAIPSYDYGRWLPEAIESALAQTYRATEVVVVDDGSTDGSAEIAHRYAAAHPARIRVSTHPDGSHRGIAATTNRCVEEARGVYWCALPADDVLLPDKVARQVALLEANPAAALVYGYTRVVDDEGRPATGSQSRLGDDLKRHPRPLEWMLHRNCVPAVSALVRREALVRFAPRLFDERLVYSDWDVWLRLLANGEAIFEPRVVAESRVHGRNSSLESDDSVRLRRTLDVLNAIDADASEIGGAFDAPRLRAAARFELALLHHRLGALDAADRWAAAAFAADPSIERDARWLKEWVRARINRRWRPDDVPGHLLAHAPASLRAALERPFAALRLEQEARAAARRGDRRAGLRLARRALRLEPSRGVQVAYLRLVATLLIGRTAS